MKSFDSRNGEETQMGFALELTRVPPLWNHPKTVALDFASGESFPNYVAERSNFCICTSVKQG
ncbi:MAG: hypothetical protein WBR10_02445 [Candidatus Acidiferrum sp.]